MPLSCAGSNTAVSETLLPEVEGRTELPLLPLTPRMTVPETGLDEG